MGKVLDIIKSHQGKNMGKISKEQKQLNRLVEKLRTKVFKGNGELNYSEMAFAKYFVKSFVSDKVLNEPSKLTFERTWDIKLFHAFNEFKQNIQNIKVSAITDNHSMILLLKEIFILQSYMKKTKKYDFLLKEISMYYRCCFMNDKDIKPYVIFDSKKMRIETDFKSNSVILIDKVKNKMYERDIQIDELTIFPNARLKHQFIG